MGFKRPLCWPACSPDLSPFLHHRILHQQTLTVEWHVSTNRNTVSSPTCLHHLERHAVLYIYFITAAASCCVLWNVLSGFLQRWWNPQVENRASVDMRFTPSDWCPALYSWQSRGFPAELQQLCVNNQGLTCGVKPRNWSDTSKRRLPPSPSCKNAAWSKSGRVGGGLS